MWKLLTSLPPERIVQSIDFHHLRDALTEDELLEMVKTRLGARDTNLAKLERAGRRPQDAAGNPYQPAGFAEGKPLTISGSLRLAEKIAPGEYVVQVAIRDLEAPKKYQFAVRTAEFEVRP